MNRLFASAGIIVAVAAGVVNLVFFRLEIMLAPADGLVEIAEYAAFAAIIILVVTAFWTTACRLPRATVSLLVAIVAVSFLPRAVDAARRDIATRSDRAEGAALETAFLTELRARQSDVAARIAAKRAYAGEEAFAFVMFVDGADLSWRGFPDHTAEAAALLEAALQAGVVDPNARPSGGKALFLRFYDARIKPTAPRLVAKREWEIEKRLVAHGADLGDPAATELETNLARKETPGPGRFLALE